MDGMRRLILSNTWLQVKRFQRFRVLSAPFQFTKLSLYLASFFEYLSWYSKWNGLSPSVFSPYRVPLPFTTIRYPFKFLFFFFFSFRGKYTGWQSAGEENANRWSILSTSTLVRIRPSSSEIPRLGPRILYIRSIGHIFYLRVIPRHLRFIFTARTVDSRRKLL